MSIRIPSEYQEVEYIESTGAEHIDSEIPYNSNLSFEAVASFTDQDSGNGLFGTNDYIFSLYMKTGGATQFQNKSSQRFESSALILNTFYDFKASVSGYWLDGTLQTSKKDSGKTPTSNIFIFKAMDFLGRVKLKAFRIYSDSNFTTLVRDYVPCYRKVDREAGLYDLVSGTFFENNGTGAFKVGKAVNVIRKFQPGIVGKTNVVEGVEILFGKTYLYKDGDEREELTGGWEATNIQNTSSGSYGYTPTLTKNSDSMEVSVPSGATRRGTLRPKNNYYDFTPYKELKILLKEASVGECSFALSTTNTKGYNDNKVAYLDFYDAPAGVYSLDLSNINQSLYLNLPVNAFGSSRVYLNISRIWFEK